MKQISTFFSRNITLILVFIMTLAFITRTSAQVTPNVCSNPSNFIYGLTGSGAIQQIDVSNANAGTVVKNTTYSGNSPSRSNGLGYNIVNGKFYYFKRNIGASPVEFISFDPTTNTVVELAACPLPSEIHTGCVSVTGLGYYTIDVTGNMAYYNIASNSWTSITSSFIDQYSNNVTAVITAQSAGDITIDGYGNLWIITSSNSNFAIYRLSAPLPTTAVGSLTVTQILPPTTPTPSGNSIAGIAFNPTGQFYLATRGDDRLYRLENNFTTTFIGGLTVSDVGNDLTSCSFPTAVLPVTWLSFDVDMKSKKTVELNWNIVEQKSKGFYVQHSLDGSNWTELAFIPSKSNEQSILHYSYTHINNLNGKQYYRLRQQDLNTRESYSQIRMVVLKNEDPGITFWPNPATESISFYNNSGEGSGFIKAHVFDLAGHMVIEKNLQPGLNSVNIATLNKGVYILKLQGLNQNTSTQKIIKQ